MEDKGITQIAMVVDGYVLLKVLFQKVCLVGYNLSKASNSKRGEHYEIVRVASRLVSFNKSQRRGRVLDAIFLLLASEKSL